MPIKIMREALQLELQSKQGIAGLFSGSFAESSPGIVIEAALESTSSAPVIWGTGFTFKPKPFYIKIGST